VTLQLHSL